MDKCTNTAVPSKVSRGATAVTNGRYHRDAVGYSASAKQSMCSQIIRKHPRIDTCFSER